ncbi:MAG: PIG-L deacetylase family protein [Bacillota bacterium]
MSRLTLMPIFAHPDDESFVGTGSLITHVRSGGRAALVCATRGERGKPGDPPLCTLDELPQVREAELKNACQILGIETLYLLDYVDKELSAAPEEEALRKIVSAIRAERPQVLYTFPPDGHSGHPDHLAIHRLANRAFRAAGDGSLFPEAGAPWQPTHLYWHIWPGRTEGLSFDARIDTSGTQATWVAALRAHRTQHQSIERVWQAFDPAFLAQRMDTEYFHLADTVLERPSAPVTDLFFGVR